jgi:ribosomal 50S subunit-associated protein YjgA (DUF615 family)
MLAIVHRKQQAKFMGTLRRVLSVDKFCRIVDCMKYSHSKAMAVLHKIVKLVKNGVLMIIHIYAKVSKY